MGKEQYTFEDFIKSVGTEHTEFYQRIHQMLEEQGCKEKVELKKTGYFVSYKDINTKKALLNFSTRKKGILVRLYGENSDQYMHLFDKLPESMQKEIKKGGSCKRMLNPNDCNAKCKMGITVILDGEIHKKCRYSALLFLVDVEKYDALEILIKAELEERKTA